MVTTAVPRALPPHSRALRNHRYEAQIAGPNPRRERSWIVRSTGRFVKLASAQTWAEAWRKPGERVFVTYYSALDGWQSHAMGQLTDAGWQEV